jgi:hypothetical protein
LKGKLCIIWCLNYRNGRQQFRIMIMAVGLRKSFTWARVLFPK